MKKIRKIRILDLCLYVIFKNATWRPSYLRDGHVSYADK